MAEAFERQYELLDHLGDGAFAMVRACRRRADGRVLACKSLRAETLQSKVFQEGAQTSNNFHVGTSMRRYIMHTPTQTHNIFRET